MKYLFIIFSLILVSGNLAYALAAEDITKDSVESANCVGVTKTSNCSIGTDQVRK